MCRFGGGGGGEGATQPTTMCPSSSHSLQTIVDECEESQLEAAIRASLAETQASSKPYYLVDSDDQCSPVVSSDESDEVVCGRRRRKARGGIHSSSSEDERVTSPFAHHIPSDMSLDPLVGDDQSSSAGHRERGKKRHCSFETNGELPRKLLKQIVSSRLDDTASEQCESAVGRKGKERAGSSGVAKKTKAVPLLPGQTLEEQLASGAVSARDVAVLLVRLPDGTRVEKAFNRTHPIQVRTLFSNCRRLAIRVTCERAQPGNDSPGHCMC